MSFVKLDNLNDFIQPSSACIKPIEKNVAGQVTKVKDVNLSDCLACSGCITSAETVLVQQQNYEELFRAINSNKQTSDHQEIVVSMSLQAIASIAYKNSMDLQETAERIASFLVSIGCDKVCDINVARHLSLFESSKEFQARKVAKSPDLPMIASACPGWICYAEKTNGDIIIPHLSKVRSPQQVMGALLRKRYSRLNKRLYHVTLMPCFDKKLEASRVDFKSDVDGTKDVDCVLTPIELEEILNDEGVDLSDFEARRLDVLIETGFSFDNPLTSNMGSVSGGYADNLLLADVTKTLGDDIARKGQVVYKTNRNSDFIELDFECPGIEVDRTKLSKFAIINGFRNIQTMVMRLKRKMLKYDYIEVMACPSGCINGGAQCKPNNGDNQSDCIAKATEKYRQAKPIELNVYELDNITLVKNLGIDDESLISCTLYTEFHPVPKTQGLSVNW